MSNAIYDESSQSQRHEFYTNVVIPTARAMEGLAWRVAWFTVLLKVLF
jgi:hypothetical protein